jgi:hypothetical protein
VDAYLQSISAAPKLQSLTGFSGRHIERLAQLWWRRIGQPPLNLAGLADGQRIKMQARLQKFDGEWDSTSAAAAAATVSSSSVPALSVPAIRELVVPRGGRSGNELLSGCSLPFLAHLPHLRTLDCDMTADDLAHLALLPQLHSLTLQLYGSEGHFYGPLGLPWTNTTVRAVADTRLPHLHTLRLGSDETHCSMCSDAKDVFNPFPYWNDPDCAVTQPSGRLRTAHSDLTVEGGMRHLLQLPALTQLVLPYVPID